LEYTHCIVKALALSLAALLVLEATAPGLSSGVESKLPACCRSDGKHQCAMQRAVASAPWQSPVLSARSACPLFPKRALSNHSFGKLTPAPERLFYAAILSHPAVQSQTAALFRIAYDRSRQKRGPPCRL
jgi:hypothetical protein